MAVIIRKGLQTDQAKNILNQATQRASVYNANISALQQQSAILSGQQQNLMLSTQETIGDVNRNIYQAQRSARAQSAALGLIGGVDAARGASELQDQVGYELGNIVSQANKGAISIASQQSGINEALVMNAQQEILDIYADELISSGDPSVSIDWGRQLQSGLQGALTGALTGAGIGFFGPKAGDKLSGAGALKAGIAGAAVGAGTNFVADKMITMTQDYWSQEYQDSYNESEWAQRGGAYSAAAGGLAGAAIGAGMKKYGKTPTGFPKDGTGFWTKGLRANPGKFKAFNPTPLTLATAGIGGILGGLSAGLDKKYKLNYDNLMQSGTAQDFAGMGIDLTALTDIIKGR